MAGGRSLSEATVLISSKNTVCEKPQHWADKTLLVNACMHLLSKYDFVGVQDFDELLVPSPLQHAAGGAAGNVAFWLQRLVGLRDDEGEEDNNVDNDVDGTFTIVRKTTMLITMHLHHSEEDNNVDNDVDGTFTIVRKTVMLITMFLHHSVEDNTVDNDAEGIFTIVRKTTMLITMLRVYSP